MPVSRGWGKPMGGCAQPATLSGFLPRCCVAFAAAAVMGLGLAATGADAAPATKRADQAGTPRTITPRIATTTPTQTQPVQPRKIRVVHRERRERTSERASTDLGDRLNKNTVVIVSGGLESTDLAITH